MAATAAANDPPAFDMSPWTGDDTWASWRTNPFIIVPDRIALVEILCAFDPTRFDETYAFLDSSEALSSELDAVLGPHTQRFCMPEDNKLISPSFGYGKGLAYKHVQFAKPPRILLVIESICALWCSRAGGNASLYNMARNSRDLNITLVLLESSISDVPREICAWSSALVMPFSPLSPNTATLHTLMSYTVMFFYKQLDLFLIAHERARSRGAYLVSAATRLHGPADTMHSLTPSHTHARIQLWPARFVRSLTRNTQDTYIKRIFSGQDMDISCTHALWLLRRHRLAHPRLHQALKTSRHGPTVKIHDHMNAELLALTCTSSSPNHLPADVCNLVLDYWQ
jgi:hypothetical protein